MNIPKIQNSTTITKIKTHLQNNKTTYIAVGATAVVCVSVTSAFFLGRQSVLASVEQKITQVGIINKAVNQMIIPPLGDPGNVLQCIETGTIFASQGEAARVLGVAPQAISSHLKGNMPDIVGQHLKVLGKAGQPIAA